jgi:hypothetical protein
MRVLERNLFIVKVIAYFVPGIIIALSNISCSVSYRDRVFEDDCGLKMAVCGNIEKPKPIRGPLTQADTLQVFALEDLDDHQERSNKYH